LCVYDTIPAARRLCSAGMTEPLQAGDGGTEREPGPSVDVALAPAPPPPSGSEAGVCPFLISASGDWRLAAPTREHRCGAFVPLTSLSIEKQARLCLRDAHVTCATYAASVAAREQRTGSGEPVDRVGRWGLARTAPLIEDTGGLRGTLITMVADRRTWPAIPAVLLVATLLAVGISGFRDQGQTAALASPTQHPTPTPATTAVPTIESTERPSAEPTVAPTGVATPAPTQAPTPAPSYRLYTVQSGDTLSGIAAKFHVSISSIEKLNNNLNPRALHVGQKLKIPNS
jgi:LysM repeat protein